MFFCWPFPGGSSVVAVLLIRISVNEVERFYVHFLFVSSVAPHLFFFRCLGKAMLRNCDL